SRVTREGHARFWERPEVKFLRATQHQRPVDTPAAVAPCPLYPKSGQTADSLGMSALCHSRLNALQQRHRYFTGFDFLTCRCRSRSKRCNVTAHLPGFTTLADSTPH